MTLAKPGARWRAIGSAALLLVAGAAIGITIDRLWISAPGCRNITNTGTSRTDDGWLRAVPSLQE